MGFEEENPIMIFRTMDIVGPGGLAAGSKEGRGCKYSIIKFISWNVLDLCNEQR